MGTEAQSHKHNDPKSKMWNIYLQSIQAGYYTHSSLSFLPPATSLVDELTRHFVSLQVLSTALSKYYALLEAPMLSQAEEKKINSGNPDPKTCRD